MHPLIADAQKKQLKQVPEMKPGYTVRLHQKVKEGGKERIQIFEGLVMQMSHGHGVQQTCTVRKVVEGIGVEKVFPVHSSNITKIEVKKKAEVRRGKLYYMRDRSGKSARLREHHVTDEERAAEESKREALISEAVEAEAKRQAEAAATAESAPAEEPAAEEKQA